MISKDEIKRLCKLVSKFYDDCDLDLVQIDMTDVVINVIVNEDLSISCFNVYVLNDEYKEECFTVKPNEL